MASILSRNPSPMQPMPSQTTPATGQQDPMVAINNFIQQILGAQDPAAEFNKFVASSPAAQQVMDIIKKYGNGNPEVAFNNYAISNGTQAFSQEVKRRMGLA